MIIVLNSEYAPEGSAPTSAEKVHDIEINEQETELRIMPPLGFGRVDCLELSFVLGLPLKAGIHRLGGFRKWMLDFQIELVSLSLFFLQSDCPEVGQHERVETIRAIPADDRIVLAGGLRRWLGVHVHAHGRG